MPSQPRKGITPQQKLVLTTVVSMLQSAALATNLVPVVDFGPFIDPTSPAEQKEKAAKEILQSFQEIGFVYLINHGLDADKIDGMFGWSRKLFDLPPAVKELAPHPPSGTHHRGYSAPGREKVKQLSESSRQLAHTRATNDVSNQAESGVIRDIKESFECGREDNEEMPNIWFPDGVFPGFKEACLDFYWTCYETEKLILKALAIGYNLPDHYFLQDHSKADNQLRLLHYPSIPASMLQDEKASRIPSHTDFCSMTDSIGGLEVEDPKHSGTFIVLFVTYWVLITPTDFHAL
ncbi:Proline hydroxylase buaE [Psilocybe cubensis]|uniref:Proline hydroxylase buaE n=1 Tax=Psilocybe cubensis TaxID=181762 RepID=A0ACB8GM56_PSICU|nr:Proline hydroxylase buaE [Psilocybe cubensis]KAH9476482.1 Proline hydroxylase buaE [Psilocybe cubensis]